MLRKIISIKNVGRFLGYGAAGDVELKRHNLVFAENGRGKTTLCAILRSLQTGDATHVRGCRSELAAQRRSRFSLMAGPPHSGPVSDLRKLHNLY